MKLLSAHRWGFPHALHEYQGAGDGVSHLAERGTLRTEELTGLESELCRPAALTTRDMVKLCLLANFRPNNPH